MEFSIFSSNLYSGLAIFEKSDKSSIKSCMSQETSDSFDCSGRH